MTSPLPPSNVRGFENIEDRKRYGSDSLEPLASNDPGCLYSNDVFYPYPPCKQLLAIQTQAVANPLDASALKQITEIYETDIHPAIMDTILPSHGVRDQFRALHPLRTRFNVPDDQTPITLLFVFKRDSVSVEVAKGIVTNIQMLCSSSSWPKEIPVYVDVCQPKSQGDTRASTHGDGYREDLLLTYAFLFEDLRPIPGSSIGLGGRNKYRLTGTLCCFVKHGSKIYAITNDHVANPFDGTSSPYMYVTGDKKYRIISPSQSDQDEILERINNELAVCTPGTEQEVKLNADLRKAEGYHRNLGYVIATSGSVPPSPPNDFRQDWAIIECEGNYSYENRHRRRGTDDRIFVPARIIGPMMKEGVERSWIQKTTAYLKSSPLFNGISAKLPEICESHYLKAPSARSGLKPGICNGLKHTINHGLCGITREWCFISPMPGATVSTSGDSGSSILNKEYEIVAMMWGGNDYQGIGDLTFATPFSSVLRDIES